MERNTPKWDLYMDTVGLLSEFVDNEVNGDYYLENLDLLTLQNRRYGSDEDETQEDRDNQLEGCVSIEYMIPIIRLYSELGSKIKEIEDLACKESSEICFCTSCGEFHVIEEGVSILAPEWFIDKGLPNSFGIEDFENTTKYKSSVCECCYDAVLNTDGGKWEHDLL